MLIEKLKYAIFAIADFEDINFEQKSESIRFIYNDVVVYGNENSISVFYDAEEMGVLTRLKSINKENTLKVFKSIPDAFNYMIYLSKVTSDIKYTLYHYFLYRLKEINLIYNSLSFKLVGNFQNYSGEKIGIRCTLKDLSIEGRKLKYNFLIIFKNDKSCRFSFYPEEAAWSEEKICPKRDVDKIIEYILNLKVDNYDDIPLIES